MSEQNLSRLSSPHRFFSERSDSCNHRSCPRGYFFQQKRTEHRRQEAIGLEVDSGCHGWALPPWGQGYCRCLWSTQIGRRGILFHPGKLRGETLLSCVPSVSLRGNPANEGKHASDRIVGSQGQSPFRLTLHIHIRRRFPGAGKENETGTVSPLS